MKLLPFTAHLLLLLHIVTGDNFVHNLLVLCRLDDIKVAFASPKTHVAFFLCKLLQKNHKRQTVLQGLVPSVNRSVKRIGCHEILGKHFLLISLEKIRIVGGIVISFLHQVFHMYEIFRLAILTINRKMTSISQSEVSLFRTPVLSF